MHYFIDGYNLLFRVIRGEGDVAKRRELLILDLHRKIRLVGWNATLVFDAQYYPGGSETTHFDNLEIIFSSAGETADQLILDALHHAANPLEETVVTSDKKLAWYARRRSAKTMPVEEFIDVLNRRCRNKIRQLKAKKSVKESPQPQPVKPSLRPKPKEGTQEYYLQAFEGEYQAIEAVAPKKKKEKAPPIIEPEPLSEFERWVKIFEKKLGKEEEGYGA